MLLLGNHGPFRPGQTFGPAIVIIDSTWNVDSAGNWSTAGNWSAGVPNALTDVARLLTIITANRIVTVDINISLNVLYIGDDQNYTLAASGGSVLSIGGASPAINITSTGTPTISSPIAILASLDLSNTPNTTISGIISGLGFTKSGAGNLTLSGANTFAGTLSILVGQILCGIATALNSGIDVSLANTAGVNLDLNGFDETVKSIAGGGATGGNLVLGSKTLTVNGSTDTTFSGSLSGTGGNLTKNGAGILTLAGTNTLTGAILVKTGSTLRYGSLTAFGTATVTFESGSTFHGGTGALTNSNTNNLVMGGSISFTRASANNLIWGTATVTLSADLTFNVTFSGSTFTSTGVWSGSFALTKTGPGTLSLGATNTYTGATNVNAGILTVTTTGSIPSGTTINLGDTSGSSDARVNLINGYAGAITVRSGSSGIKTLGRATGNPTWTSAITLADNVSLDSVSGTLSTSTAIAGTGNLMIEGTTGRVNINGVNTNTGTMTVNTGTLGGTGTSKGAMTVASGATLQGGTGDTNAGTLTSNGDVTLSSGAISRHGIGSTTTVSKVAVTGNLTFNGNTVNFPASALNAGTYTLYTYSGTQSGTLTMGSLPTGRTFTAFAYVAGNVTVTFT